MKTLMRTFYLAGLVCLLLAVPAIASGGGHPRYVIKAAIDTLHKKITASQTVTFTNTSDQNISEIYFHIYPNRHYTPLEKAFMRRYASYFKVDPFPEGFPDHGIAISRITADHQAADFTIEGKDATLIKVALKQALAPGQNIVLDLDFSVDIPAAFGRFGWHDNVMALARWYPILAVYNQDGWDKHPFYPFHRPFFSEAAYYKVDLTVPKEEVVIHSGDLINTDVIARSNSDEAIPSLEKQIASPAARNDAGNAYKILHIETPLPIREFSLAMSPQYGVVEAEQDGVAFKAYYLPGHEARAREAMHNSQDLMRYYAKRFGPYPYKTFSIAPVHLGYGGEQMSNLIFIDTRVFDLPQILHRYFDFLIAHETGHQWFYNIVGVNNYTQMWLEEGMNSYFQTKYLEDKYGDNTEVIDLDRLPKWVKLFIPQLTFRQTRDVRYKMAARVGFERPIISKLSSFHEPSSIFAITYGKGSRVVEMLANAVGAENFDRIFARVFKEFQFENLDLKDFERIAQQEGKADLTEFFDQWLTTTKNWDARITAVKGNAIELQRRGGIRMPTDVQVQYTDGSQEHLVWDGIKEKDTLIGSKNVRQAAVDPDHKVLDIDRTNNAWPRRVNIKPVPLYHGLYDIPIFLPDDSYNLIFGPEISNGLGIKASFQKPYDYNAYTATDYDFHEQIQRSRAGFELKNILHSQTTLNLEGMITNDYDTGEDDLVSTKVALRRELWSAAYNLTDINDHVTLYMLRNRTPGGTLLSGEGEHIRNASYLRRNESIVGTALHLDRSQPRPDPQEGFAADALLENAGHWAGGTQTFTRAMIDADIFHPFISPPLVGGVRGGGNRGSTMAYRMKYGWGHPDDKNLYELGGAEGLRGFDRKTIRGSNALLGSMEYRFPLVNDLKISVADHMLGLEQISAAVFFDGGQAWYDNFDDGKFRKDAGAGLRFHLNIGSFLEQVMIRLDVAKAIDDPKEGAHTWFGINHAF